MKAASSYRRYALGLLLVVYVFNFIDRQILGILLQPIKRDLLLSDTQLGFLSGIAFALFYTTMGIPLARLADRGSRRNLIAFSLALWSAMTAATGLARTFVQLALARVAVGIGEAGCSPPAHSLLADYYPPERRATAMSIYALGVPIGILFGYLLGGWIEEVFGWRVAFFVVGIPGVALAVVVRASLRDPPREEAAAEAPPLREVARLLWRRRTFRHISFGASLQAFVIYGASIWNPAFLERTHHMSSGEIGTWLAAIAGIGGGAGTFLGGWAADRLRTRDPRWPAWLPGVAAVVTIPFASGFYLWPARIPALLLGFAPFFLLSMHMGPTFAMTQGLVPDRMRAVAAAVLLLVINAVGLGLGPQLIGLASDWLEPSFGDDSLRVALSCLPVICAWSAMHYAAAGRHWVAEGRPD
jgi:predicted MFS family arabinose efflux permease